MNMTAKDVTKRIFTLVETNRALVKDLDLSRRLVADLGHERDELRCAVEQQLGHFDPKVVDELIGEARRESETMRSQLSEEQRAAEKLRRDRAQFARDAEATRAGLDIAKRRAATLARQLQQVERERDHMALQLEEADDALQDIRVCLHDKLGVQLSAQY